MQCQKPSLCLLAVTTITLAAGLASQSSSAATSAALERRGGVIHGEPIVKDKRGRAAAGKRMPKPVAGSRFRLDVLAEVCLPGDRRQFPAHFRGEVAVGGCALKMCDRHYADHRRMVARKEALG